MRLTSIEKKVTENRSGLVFYETDQNGKVYFYKTIEYIFDLNYGEQRTEDVHVIFINLLVNKLPNFM